MDPNSRSCLHNVRVLQLAPIVIDDWVNFSTHNIEWWREIKPDAHMYHVLLRKKLKQVNNGLMALI